MSSATTDGPHDPHDHAPQAELAALVEALGAHVRRRARFGERRTAAMVQSGPESSTANPAERVLQRPGAPEAGPAPASRPSWPRSGAPTPAAARAAPPVERGAAPGGTTSPATPQPTSARPAAQFGGAPPARATATRPPIAPAPGPADWAAKIAENRAAAAACPDLATLREAVARCTACELCNTRRQTVFADGDGAAGVLFVGEAPGANEDEQGVPFVGAAGQLLSDIIHKGMKLDRRRTAIVNVLKCRPPGNREPTDQEKALCTPWLDRQIELLAPRVVVALGRHAANHLLGYAGAARRSLGSLRGELHERRGRKVVVTFHPANLLREPENKKECWKDIQMAMRALDLPTTPPAGNAQ